MDATEEQGTQEARQRRLEAGRGAEGNGAGERHEGRTEREEGNGASPQANGPQAGKPHGRGHGENAQSEHIPQDLPKVSGKAMLLVGVVGLVLVASLFALGYFPHKEREDAVEADAQAAKDALTVVEVEHPKQQPKTFEVKLPGDVEAYRSTAIYARTSGYLKAPKFDIGDDVKANEVIAEIESPEIDAEVEQAKASLQQAEVVLGRANNEYAFNQATYDRYDGFFKTGGVTQQVLEEKRASLNIAKSSLAAATAGKKAAEAALQRNQELKGFETIRAPFAGKITERGFDAGALISANASSSGRPLFKLELTEKVKIYVDVPQRYSTQIRKETKASFLVSNYPGRKFPGAVARDAGAVNNQTRTLRVEVDLDNASHELLPGMYGSVDFEISQDKPALIVPTGALVVQDAGVMAAVVGGDGVVAMKPVTITRDLGRDAEISGGLELTDWIVSNPGDNIVDGLKVKAVDKAATTQKTKEQGK